MSPSLLSVTCNADPLVFREHRLPTHRKRLSGSLKLSPELRQDVQSDVGPSAQSSDAGQTPNQTRAGLCTAFGPSIGRTDPISDCTDCLGDCHADKQTCSDELLTCTTSSVTLEDLSWPLEILQTDEVGVGKRTEVTPHPLAPERKSRRRALAPQNVLGPHSRKHLAPLSAANLSQSSDFRAGPIGNGMALGNEPPLEVPPVKAVSLDDLTWPSNCPQFSNAQKAQGVAAEKLNKALTVRGEIPCTPKGVNKSSSRSDGKRNDVDIDPRSSAKRPQKRGGARFGARMALGRMRKFWGDDKLHLPLTNKCPKIPETGLATSACTTFQGRFPHVPWALEIATFLREFISMSLSDGGAGKRALRLGTDCAGAEAPIFAMREIRSAIQTLLGREVQIEHLFSCDVEPSSRRFIRQNCSPCAFFPDLLARTSISHCIIAERPRIVPSNLDIYVAGFPCKDFSTLNKFRECLTGPNSPIFYGVVRYIREHEPCVFVLENVSGLVNRKRGAPAPIHEVMRILRNIPGYTVRGWRVNSSDYYLPQRRRRVYIVGVHTGKTNLTKPLSAWGELLRLLSVKRPPVSALDFVLGDEEPEVQEQACHLKTKPRRKGTSAGHKWMHKHKAVTQQLGLDGTQPYTGQLRGYCPYLCERVRDVVEFTARRVADVSGCPAEQTQYFAEVSQNPEFALNTIKDNVSPCVTPAGKLWCFSKFRYLVGIEKMALQGFPADSLNLSGLSKTEVEALAGNSMSVSMVGTFLSLVLAFVNFPDK